MVIHYHLIVNISKSFGQSSHKIPPSLDSRKKNIKNCASLSGRFVSQDKNQNNIATKDTFKLLIRILFQHSQETSLSFFILRLFALWLNSNVIHRFLCEISKIENKDHYKRQKKIRTTLKKHQDFKMAPGWIFEWKAEERIIITITRGFTIEIKDYDKTGNSKEKTIKDLL